MGHRIFGHKRKAHTGHHHALDPIFPLAAERGVKLDLSLAAHSHHLLAHLAGEPVNIRVRCDVTQSHSLQAFERVTWRYNHNVALAVQRLGAKAWRVSVRCVENPEIEMACLQPAAEIDQIALMHTELDSWMFGFEAGKEGSEANRTDRGHDAKLQRCLMQKTKFARRMTGCRSLIEHLLNVWTDAISEIG